MLLYSCIGCFSYFLLVHYADIPEARQTRLIAFQPFLAVIVLFNGTGLSIRYINERLMKSYQSFLKNRRRMFIGLGMAAVILFLSNYLLLAFAKELVGLPCPFCLRGKGMYGLLTVWFVEIIVVGQFMLNRFYADLVRLYKRAEELEACTLRARYQSLQNQLNPHFLFNSLNTLISEIEYNPQNAMDFTRNLADSYRYILYCQDKHTVALSEELDFVDTYIKMQKVRLGDCLELDVRIDDDYRDHPLPPLTLQLLIENVIKHNVINSNNPMPIALSTESGADGVWLCVSNPVKLKKGVSTSGRGLKNLSQRYKLLCDKDIVIEKKDNKFVVKIPLMYE